MAAPARTTALALLLVAGTTLVACASDGATTETTVLTTVAPTVPTVVTSPPSTTPPTTPAPTTTVPPATVPPTTAAAATTASPTTTAAPTTTVPRGAALVLRDTGLGDAVFGADPDEVIAYVRAILGAPTADSGWADPTTTFGVCPGTEVRGVSWGDLTLLFGDESNITAGLRHFFSYTYGPAFGAAIDPAGLRMPNGVGVGSTVADLRAAFPGVVLNAVDSSDPSFYVSDSLTGFVSGVGDADMVDTIIGGVTCSG